MGQVAQVDLQSPVILVEDRAGQPVEADYAELVRLAMGVAASRMRQGATKGDPTRPNSNWLCGARWAQVQDTLFFRYKRFNHRGGIATPLIAHWPEGIEGKGELRVQAGHVLDLGPTLVEVCGVSYPKELGGNEVLPTEGGSLVPAFADKSIERKDIYWEHQGDAELEVVT